jgi:hypothetical protein
MQERFRKRYIYLARACVYINIPAFHVESLSIETPFYFHLLGFLTVNVFLNVVI